LSEHAASGTFETRQGAVYRPSEQNKRRIGGNLSSARFLQRDTEAINLLDSFEPLYIIYSKRRKR
jgi:hypothetical protein